MDPQADFPPTSQTPNGTHASGTDDPEILRRRIRHLEDQIKTYEQLLEDLPDLFERKFSSAWVHSWSGIACWNSVLMPMAKTRAHQPWFLAKNCHQKPSRTR